MLCLCIPFKREPRKGRAVSEQLSLKGSPRRNCSARNTVRPFEYRSSDDAQSGSRPSLPSAMPIPSCPYCQHALEKMPTRKTACKQCGKQIYVRTKQRIFPTPLLRENEATVVDALNNELSGFGITEEDFIRHMQSYRRAVLPGDVLWSLFQKKIGELLQRGEFQTLPYLSYCLALFLNREGRSHNHVLKDFHRYKLMQFKEEGRENVKIRMCCEQLCSACKELEGNILSIDEALRTTPLPHEGCTHTIHNEKYGFCRCDYIPEPLFRS